MNKKQVKKFWSMKQLDRIEYFLHREYNKDQHQLQILNYVGAGLHLMFMVIVLGILMYAHFDSYGIIKALGPLFLVLKYGLGIVIIFDILSAYSKYKSDKFLNKQFNVEKK